MIPVFNCDSTNHHENTKYLNIHREHYGIPFCNNKLVFEKKLWGKIPQTKICPDGVYCDRG